MTNLNLISQLMGKEYSQNLIWWTKMDTSALITLNPTVKINNTAKCFFNKYLYKANFYVPGGRLIADYRKMNIEKALQRRIELLSYRSKTHSIWMNSYSSKMTEQLKKDADIQQLNYFHNIKKKFRSDVKMRVEEPTLSIYTNDVQLFQKIIMGDPVQRIKEVWIPSDSQAHSLLNEQIIIVKKQPKYKYRVYLKLAKVTVENKQQIANYLISLNDEVEMIKSCYDALQSNNSYHPSSYFYCNDENIIFFIQLINPHAISGIYKLVYEPLNNSKESQNG